MPKFVLFCHLEIFETTIIPLVTFLVPLKCSSWEGVYQGGFQNELFKLPVQELYLKIQLKKLKVLEKLGCLLDIAGKRSINLIYWSQFSNS